MHQTKPISFSSKVTKVDEALGLVFGYGIICTEGGEPYYDLQGDHIPDDVMLEAATDFMVSSRVAKEMHEGEERGTVVFSFPMTAEIAKVYGISVQTTGWLVAMRPDAAMLAKFKAGELTGFSIGGDAVVTEVE